MLRRELQDVNRDLQIGTSACRLTGQPQLSVPPLLDLEFPQADPGIQEYRARHDVGDQLHRIEMEAMRSEIRELRHRVDSLSSNRHYERVDATQAVSNSPYPPTPSNGNDNSQSLSHAFAIQGNPEFDDIDSLILYDLTDDEGNQTAVTATSHGGSGPLANPGLTEAETTTISSGLQPAQPETTSVSVDPLNDVSLPFRWHDKSTAIAGNSPLLEGYPQGTSPE